MVGADTKSNHVTDSANKNRSMLMDVCSRNATTTTTTAGYKLNKRLVGSTDGRAYDSNTRAKTCKRRF